MWKIESFDATKWVTHLLVSLGIVLFLHRWHSPPPPPLTDDVPDDLLLREEVVKVESSSNTLRLLESSDMNKKSSDNTLTSKQRLETTKQKKTTTTIQQPSTRRISPQRLPQTLNPPPFRQHTDHNLTDYWQWHDTETSLFRMYEMAHRNVNNTSDFTAIPPSSNSRRGNVRIGLQVTNDTELPIDVYWMDYKGREIHKGRIVHQWEHTTWIDHPWVFRQTNGQLLLYYVPYRVIPTTHMALTTADEDDDLGIHRFKIGPSTDPQWACSIEDPILPFPANKQVTTPQMALNWALLHCTRMTFRDWDLLLKCGTNILQHPDEPRYRSFRISNPQFGPRLWNTTARGVFLAAGFYEHAGYVQVGGNSSQLSREEVQELSLWVWKIQTWKEQIGSGVVESVQPVGADGYGRAGFGRAGHMNTSFF